jgi:hypothetical protein
MAIAGDFDDLTHSCSSTRYLGPYGSEIEDVLGSFGANVQAIVTDTFDGATRTGIQIEGARTNVVDNSQVMGSWTIDGITVNDNTSETDDPIGTNTAEEIVLTTDTGGHKIYESNFLGAAITESAHSVFFKEGDTGFGLARRSGTSTQDVSVDLSDGSIDHSTGTIDEGTEDAGDGWYYIYWTGGACGQFSTMYFMIQPQETAGAYQSWWAPASADGIYAWQYQTELEVHYPSSIIPTSGTSNVTRAAVDAYWDENDVDSNLRGEITVYLIPGFSSAMLYDDGGDHVILHFDDATQDIAIYMEPGTSADTGRIIVEGASALVTTGNHTWSRGQLLKIVINPDDGEVTTSLFTTGNDTHSGSSWSTDDGDVYLGQSSSNDNHFFGVIFQPEYEEAGVAVEEVLFYGRVM